MNVCSLSPERLAELKTRIKQKNKNKTHKYKRKKLPYKQIVSVIPLHLYQVWHNLNEIPQDIQESIDAIQKQNPEFEHHLYDEKKCRRYIQTHFPSHVLDAYDAIVPHAYKADLWRYCILYKKGGIYLDSKYCGMDGFKLLQLTDKEYFCKDIENSFSGIYNAILVCKPNNPILLKCIHKVVENVQNKYYGSNPMCIGPLMMKSLFTEQEISKFELSHETVKHRLTRYICLNEVRILKCKKNKVHHLNHWSNDWREHTMYK